MNSVVPDDLYVRWTQFGVFFVAFTVSRHLRKREPYEFPNIADTVRKWLKLRYALIPYIFEQSEKITQTGYPMVRPMLMHNAKDRICWHIDDQYYFGDDFLVAPVMNSENVRDIYLPEGNWVNFFTGDIRKGGRWLYDMPYTLDMMPVWVKDGAQIPIYVDEVSNTDHMELERAELITIDEDFEGIFELLGL